MHGMLIMKMDINKIVINETQLRDALQVKCNPIRQTCSENPRDC